MIFKILILFLLISPSFQQSLDNSPALNSNTSVNRTLEIQDNIIKWQKLCDQVGHMLQTTDEAKKIRIDVVIHDFSRKSKNKYEGFYVQLTRLGNYRISMKIVEYFFKTEQKVDYAILLITEGSLNYADFVMKTFSSAYDDKSLKIIAIMSDYKSINNLKVLFSALVRNEYYNVYLMSHNTNGDYNLYRANYEIQLNTKPIFFAEKVQDTKFVLFKNRLSDDHRKELRLNVIFYNNFPMTYMRNDQIVGAEGNLIRELTTKLKVPYKVINNPETAMSPNKVLSMIKSPADLCLYINFILLKKDLDGAWLHDMDGLCLLIPRNIPVSSYENFTQPLDNASLILAFISTILLIVVWKFISPDRSIPSILLSVYELVLNLGASGIEDLSSHENIMIYCYIFGSFILMSFYETVILSFMLTDSTMRSALNLKELNETNTKFYSFYDRNISIFANLPLIRDELIMNHINLLNMFQLEVPENFDEHLVYLVSCKYADSFLKSSNNFRGDRRLFDKLILTQTYQRITTRSDFFYIEELRDMIERFEESGIYKLWEKDMIEQYQRGFQSSNDFNSGREYVDFGDMGLPLLVLLIGCLISLFVFFTELINRRYRILILNKVGALGHGISRLRIRKANLNKWKEKFIFKKKLTFAKPKAPKKQSIAMKASKNSKQESIKCRESVKGGYFMIKKFRSNRIKKRVVRRIKVHPYQENST